MWLPTRRVPIEGVTSGRTVTQPSETLKTKPNVARAASLGCDARPSRFRPDIHVLCGPIVRFVRPMRPSPVGIGESRDLFGTSQPGWCGPADPARDLHRDLRPRSPLSERSGDASWRFDRARLRRSDVPYAPLPKADRVLCAAIWNVSIRHLCHVRSTRWPGFMGYHRPIARGRIQGG